MEVQKQIITPESEKKISFSEPGLLHFLYFCSHINFSANFLISSCSWIQFRRVYVSHCLYPFISWWMSRMTLCSSWCEYIKHEQGCAVYLCEKIKRPFSTWPVMVQSGHIIILFFSFLKKKSPNWFPYLLHEFIVLLREINVYLPTYKYLLVLFS